MICFGGDKVRMYDFISVKGVSLRGFGLAVRKGL